VEDSWHLAREQTENSRLRDVYEPRKTSREVGNELSSEVRGLFLLDIRLNGYNPR
jgi:hypothetical protein